MATNTAAAAAANPVVLTSSRFNCRGIPSGESRNAPKWSHWRDRWARATSVTATVSYNIPVGSYAEISAQNDARTRGGELLAERMRTDLALRMAAVNAKKT